MTFVKKTIFQKLLRSVSRASFSKIWYLEEVLASIPWQIASCEVLSSFCPASFGVIFCSVVTAADTHIKLLVRAVSGASFLTGGVFECDIAHRRSVSVLCMRYKIRCNPMHPLYGALPDPYAPVRVTCVLWSHIGTLMRLAAEPRSTAGLLFTCQYFCGTILVTPYSMVWVWQVSRAGPMLFYRPSCSLHFCLLLISLSLLSFYLLVLWGFGLWTDIVLISLSQTCTANLFK